MKQRVLLRLESITEDQIDRSKSEGIADCGQDSFSRLRRIRRLQNIACLAPENLMAYSCSKTDQESRLKTRYRAYPAFIQISHLNPTILNSTFALQYLGPVLVPHELTPALQQSCPVFFVRNGRPTPPYCESAESGQSQPAQSGGTIPPAFRGFQFGFSPVSRVPPEAMILCIWGGKAVTFWLQVGPFSPSFTVTVDWRMSHVNFLLKHKPFLSILRWQYLNNKSYVSTLTIKLPRNDFETTYQPVLPDSFFSFSKKLRDADSDSSETLFYYKLTAYKKKTSRSLCTSLGTSIVQRPLLIALRPKMFPKLPNYRRVKI